MIQSGKTLTRRTDLRIKIRRDSTASKIPQPIILTASTRSNPSLRMPDTREVSTRSRRTSLLRNRTTTPFKAAPSVTSGSSTSTVKARYPPTASTSSNKRRRTASTATNPTFSTSQKARAILPITPPRTPRPDGSPLPSHSNPGKPAEAKTTSTSLTVGPHMCAPCSKDCLIHTLSSCKHRIMTEGPQPCARNCAYAREPSPFGYNTRDLDKPFICPRCTDDMFSKDVAAKRRVLDDYLKRLKALYGVDGQSWDEWSGRIITDAEGGWFQTEECMREALRKNGRVCRAISGDVRKGKEGFRGNSTTATSTVL